MNGNVLVSGGCGFIGSHLVDALMMNQDSVTVVDNLSNGKLENLKNWRDSPKFKFVENDLTDPMVQVPKDCSIIYHVAANPDVRTGATSPGSHFEQNIVATYNLLETVRKSSANAVKFVFTSTSTVYGEAELMPTPEEYGPLKPISIYGASKLACEALISSYASTYGFGAVIFRLANVIGQRSTHGIIYDFLQKLKTHPSQLEILGDGSQTKSYLHVEDCVTGILTGVRNTKDQVAILNIGSEDQINVMKIAEKVCAGAGFHKVKYKMTPATPDGRGWLGDVKFMRLDVSKLKSLGWSPKMNSEEAVTKTVSQLVKELFTTSYSIATG